MESEFYGDGQHNGGVFYSGNLNPYIYTYQNPIMFIDPNGKQSNWLSRLRQKTSSWSETNIRKPLSGWVDENIRQPSVEATQPLRDGLAWTPERTAEYNAFLERNGVLQEKRMLNETMQELGDNGLLLGSGMGTGLVGAYGRVWRTTSDNNFVGKLATRLGRIVKGVDIPYKFEGGVGDVDIMTNLYNIEVKSGNKMKISQSLKNAKYAESVNKRYLLYMPKATQRQIFDAEKKGIRVIKTEKELKKILK